jgi:spore coat protein U-like protein
MLRKLRIALSGLVAVLALFLASAPASAQTTDDDTFDVTITVQNACTISVENLSFGIVNDLTPVISGSTEGTVTCTAAAPVSVAFNLGTAGGTFATRLMANGTDTIGFNLYSEAAAGDILGDGTSGTETIELTSTGDADTFQIYGRTVAAQNPKPLGTYSTTVTATVTF